MLRDIVKIDEKLCDGCGVCVPNCHEGALQIIDGKARLISELACDGLGACIGHCPQDAISVENREAEPYDESKVVEDMIKKGKNTLIAHFKHLKDHNEDDYIKEGLSCLENNKEKLKFNLNEIKDIIYPNKKEEQKCNTSSGGCPGTASKEFIKDKGSSPAGEVKSQLSHWPVQLHLINPGAGYFKNSDLLIAADCTAYAAGNFHNEFLKGKTLAIACPKLDSNQEIYKEKIKDLIEKSEINTLTVLMMQVPCCGGLIQLVKQVTSKAIRKVPVKAIIIDPQGKELADEWI